MLGSDTAKQDLILIAVGLLAAAFFYWMYSLTHPLNVADSSLGEENALQYSGSELNRLGYMATEHSYAKYEVETDILERLQKKTIFPQDYGKSDSLRSIAPAFHWQIDQRVTVDEQTAARSNITSSAAEVQVILSENGSLLAFVNPDNIFPTRVIETTFLEQVIPNIQPQLQEIRRDTSVFDHIKFQFDEPEVNSTGGTILLGRDEASFLGRLHLESSGWIEEYFEEDQIELISFHGTDAVRVQYVSELPELERNMQLTMDLLPTGTLVSLNYKMINPDDTADSWVDIQFGLRVAVIFLFALWVVILLFIRIRLRLIDTKQSVFVAVLAGFSYPFLFLSEWAHQYFYTFKDFQLPEIFGMLFGLGIVAALSSIVYFSTTAIGDSITRENWGYKLRTSDLLRIGHIYNHPVGIALVRAVAYSYLLALLWTVIFILFPESYISVPETFRSNRFILPSASVLIENILLYLIIVQSFLLIGLGKLRSYTKNWLVLSVFTAVIFMVVNLLTAEAGPWTTGLALSGTIGLVVGWIYCKEDYLTILVTLFLFGIHLMSAPGWVFENSPDASVFYVCMLFIIAVIIFGVIGIYKGKSINELPEYEPDYIDELKQDERVKQELQIARKVQKSFLPGQMPDIAGLEVAAICTPALETGGDYYDFIPMGENQLAVTIGDVSGKGIEAAFYMTFTKGVLHTLCTDYQSAIEILVKINDLFRRNARKGTFISLIFGIIDFEKHSFNFARAGHNPLLHYNAENNEVKEYRPDGIGLGLASQDIFRKNITESTILLKSGDILVLYTDGVVEATNASNKFYGENRLKQLIRNSIEKSANEIVRTLTDDLVKFGEGSDQHDDMTVIVIKKE